MAKHLPPTLLIEDLNSLEDGEGILELDDAFDLDALQRLLKESDLNFSNDEAAALCTTLCVCSSFFFHALSRVILELASYSARALSATSANLYIPSMIPRRE